MVSGWEQTGDKVHIPTINGKHASQRYRLTHDQFKIFNPVGITWTHDHINHWNYYIILTLKYQVILFILDFSILGSIIKNNALNLYLHFDMKVDYKIMMVLHDFKPIVQN